MAYINFQPQPKIPPIGFFQPISADPRDMMTDVEFLLGVLKKLNELIAQVNQNTEFINNYSGKIEELEARLLQVEKEVSDFETEVNETLAREFANIRLEVQALIATCLSQANAYTDTVKAQLEEEIDAIVAGQIEVYDPTTGIQSPIQTVINNLYNNSRGEALTASEYDALELTAYEYDDSKLTAQQYDMQGKTILTQ